MTTTELIKHLLMLATIILVVSCSTSKVGVKEEATEEEASEQVPPMKFEETSPPEEWVAETLQQMSLEEKVGQLIMARAYGNYVSTDSDEFERLARLVEERRIGGVAMFQGDVYATAVLLNKLQRISKVPLLVGADFERGLAMRTRRGTYFPDAMAIGATRNSAYAYRVGRAIAGEARAIGVHQNFAPVADVNNNPSNPVINTRSFGEDLRLVSSMVTEYVRGLEDGGVVATVKHFPGHGDTGVDSHLDLPVLTFNRGRLDSLELVSFKRAVDAGVMAVMIAHLAVPALDPTPGLPASLSHRAITDVLRNEMGFHGLVVTDAMDMTGLMRGFSSGDAAVKAVKAGADILLIPSDVESSISAVLAAVRNGELAMARIDQSVRRILEVKHWLRLDRQPVVDIDGVGDHVGTREHLALARDVARKAVTVVRNEGNILPLQHYGRKKLISVIISDTEDNRTEVNRASNPYPNEPFGAYFSQLLRKRYGAVETFRLTPASDSQLFDTIIGRLQRADAIILPLYVKVRSASGKIGIPDNVIPFLTRLAELKKPTVVISFGNPYVIGAFPSAQALICAYADAEPMVEATVEAMFGEIEVFGKLPVSIPGKFAYGAGLQYGKQYLRTDDPIVVGFVPERLERVDSIVTAAVRDSAFPAAQVVVVKDGVVAYNRSFGTYTYEPNAREIDESTLFDLASLTKVFATTPAVMKLYDQGKIRLDDRVNSYLPQFSRGKKDDVTIRQLLLHTSGLPPFRRLYETCKTADEALDSIYATPLVAVPGDSTIYSDLGMIILGKVVEKVSGLPLSDYVSREFYQPLRMVNTVFTPSKGAAGQIAPTEVDSVWRRGLVRGSVHDETAALLGGVAGNAGLFSTASDLSIFMQMIFNGGTYGGNRYLSDSTVAMFTRRESAASNRALGWDLKSAKGSTAGDLFSMASFGHTGFTGTSVWADPARNLFVILLTNRVHPTRLNMKISKVRPALHDAIMRALRPDALQRKELERSLQNSIN